MTTPPSYHRDAYLTELDSEVTASGETDGRPWVVLADTIFYPEGGGQPADHGIIGGVAVVDVQKKDDAIHHFLAEASAGGTVHLTLNWLRRWDHMQQHTAQHLLTAVAQRDFGWRTKAFHLGEQRSDIELDVARLDREDLDRLEEVVAQEIRAARPVTNRSAEVSEFERLGVRSRRLPEGFAGTVRLVEIEGVDLNTCGGTHLRSTADIGALSLLGTEAMRGGTRLFFVAGDRVRHRLREHERRNADLRSILDCGDDDLPAVIATRIEREKTLARANRLLGNELAEVEATRLVADSDSTVSGHWESRDMGFLQTIARRIAEVAPGKRALLSSSGDDGSVFVIVAGEDSGIDLGEIGPKVAEVLGGRGGGRAPIFQGKAESLGKRDRALEILRDS